MLALTSRETEVAHLVGKGLSNPEIAAELFISRKAVEYHLGNIYAKCGLPGRGQLRRLVEEWQPADHGGWLETKQRNNRKLMWRIQLRTTRGYGRVRTAWSPRRGCSSRRGRR